MEKKRTKIVLLIAVALVVFSAISVCSAQDVRVSYQLLDQINGSVTYQLNIVVPENLHEYYMEKSHRLTSSNSFASFVTPYALQPIADRLWEIYHSEEDFANGVLMIVHQITYLETTPVKYPVETIVDGQGDCDLFSFIAASVMKAGGLDVVLLYYEEQAHMNIGVHLSTAPQATRDSAYYVTVDNTRYYVAECTGGNWEDGWRVGECPPDLKQVSAQTITMENMEQIAPGQVSASFTTMELSQLSLQVSPIITLQNSAVTISGQLTPEIANEYVTIYASINSSPWITIGTVSTKTDGSFDFFWIPETAGAHVIRAAWSGNEQYTGSTSQTRSATVIPLFLSALIVVAVIAVIIGAAAVLVGKHSQQDFIEPY